MWQQSPQTWAHFPSGERGMGWKKRERHKATVPVFPSTSICHRTTFLLLFLIMKRLSLHTMRRAGREHLQYVKEMKQKWDHEGRGRGQHWVSEFFRTVRENRHMLWWKLSKSPLRLALIAHMCIYMQLHFIARMFSGIMDAVQHSAAIMTSFVVCQKASRCGWWT